MKEKFRFSDFIVILDIILAVLLYEVKNSAYLILLIGIIALLISNKGKLRICILANLYVIFAVLFVSFGFISSIWAIGSVYAIKAALTTLIWLIWFILLVNIYQNRQNDFLRCFSLGVDIIAIYTVMYYGVSKLVFSALSILRIDNGFNNINTLGLLFAINILISFYNIMFNKSHKEWIQIVFMTFMVVAMSSRKAMFIVIVGCILLTYMKLKNEKAGKRLLKTFLVVIVVVIVLYCLRNTSIMLSVLERIDGVLGIFKFTGFHADGSTLLRQKYIDIGMDVFAQHKLTGIGLDNSRFYIQTITSHNTYLHNNFVELLCDVGLIGFALYYLPHLIIVVTMLRNRKSWLNIDKLIFTMEIILLMLDYGRVSYYERTTWLYMVPIFFSYMRLYKNEIVRRKVNGFQTFNSRFVDR